MLPTIVMRWNLHRSVDITVLLLPRRDVHAIIEGMVRSLLHLHPILNSLNNMHKHLFRVPLLLFGVPLLLFRVPLLLFGVPLLLFGIHQPLF